MRPMDIATYLKEGKVRLGTQSDQIKDYSVFNFHYIPWFQRGTRMARLHTCPE